MASVLRSHPVPFTLGAVGVSSILIECVKKSRWYSHQYSDLTLMRAILNSPRGATSVSEIARLKRHYSLISYKLSAHLFADLYTYAYFGNRAFSHLFPKYYLDLGWQHPSFTIKSQIAWNAQQQVWDFTNVITEWTINRDFAFAVEFRHRSKYDWRKGNHENFILDVARPIDELLNSPLSDARNTLLSRFFFRLTPKWTCQLQMRNGWARRDEPAFNTGKIDLFYMLTCSWRIRLSYERMPNDNRFSTSINLVK